MGQMNQHERSFELLEVLFTPKEAAEILKVTPTTVHNLVTRGELRCIQVTSKIRRFSMEHLLEHLELKTTALHIDVEPCSDLPSTVRKGGGKRDEDSVQSPLKEELDKLWQ